MSIQPSSNNSGFTLIESMISAVLIGLVLLGMASVYMFATNQFQTIVRKNAIEEEIMWITYYLKGMLSQSDSLNVTHHIDTDFTEAAGNNATLDTSTIIKEYICNGCDSCGDHVCFTTPDPEAIAVFNRQTGYPDSGSLGGVEEMKYEASAIFFEAPRIESGGKLHIVYGGDERSGLSDNSGKVIYEIKSRTPTATDIRRFEKSIAFDNIVRFNFESSQAGGSNRAAGASITFTSRYYLTNHPRDKHTYCFNSRESACITRDPYWDIESSININFKNNHVGDLTNDRGKLYFYKMIKPPSA